MIELRHQSQIDWNGAHVLIKDADFTNPFETGVEYSSPARGPWNIVHTGMLMPESHQIFVCAQSCLRGVVLTAAEMNAETRFSTITIEEHNVLDGDMEKLIIDGVGAIISKLSVRPRAILLFTSCIHHFIGCDLKYVYDKLHLSFPDIDITDCYMNPTMRKTLTPPDVKMRQQLYSVLHKTEERDNGVNFIGNNFATDLTGEFGMVLTAAGCTTQDGAPFARDICSMKTYDEFQQMAKSRLNITTNPAAILAGTTLEQRFGTPHLHLPLCYDSETIEHSISQLHHALMKDTATTPIDLSSFKEQAHDAIVHTAAILGDTPIAIDYTATSRPLGLAKLLLTNRFNVVAVYADSFIAQEKEDFDFLKEHFPTLNLFATIHPKMAIIPANTNGICHNVLYDNLLPHGANDGIHPFTLAIGQKAAYFNNTTHFVNLIEGNGLWGYSGITKLMAMIEDAYQNPKDTAQIIQVKGWGCLA